MPSDRVSKDKPDKAQVILAGALQVFTTHGYAATSMNRIATAAGVSKPTLYSYFQSKEGLFVALIQQLTEENERLCHLQAANQLQLTPQQVLRDLANSVLEHFASNQSLAALMRLLISESDRFPELSQTFIREVEVPLLGALSRYLASQPQLNLPDPQVTARVFVGSLVHYLIIQHILHGGELLPLERDRMITGLIELITGKGNEGTAESSAHG